jgi:hypothetical protein
MGTPVVKQVHSKRLRPKTKEAEVLRRPGQQGFSCVAC